MTRALIISACLLAVTLTGCASSPTISPADRARREQLLSPGQQIIPGVLMGPIKLGMAWDEVIALLGEPDYSNINPGNGISPVLEYDGLRIFFTTNATPTVVSINLQATVTAIKTFGELMWSDFEPTVNPDFRTLEGIGLGSSSFDVARKLGSYTDQGGAGISMNYPTRGIDFIVTRDHRVWLITVTPPRNQ